MVSTWLFQGHCVYPLGRRIQNDMASRLPFRLVDVTLERNP
jgi:hypothetical protein